MLSISLLFDFISSLLISLFLEIILVSSAIKKREFALFSIEYFLSFFRYWADLQTSGGSSFFRGNIRKNYSPQRCNEASAEIGNIF